MKKVFLLVILICTCCLMHIKAQRNEVGISIGRANIIGDIGKTDYIEIFPMDRYRIPISLGVLYRYNLDNRQSLRLNLIYNRVYFDDEKASEDYRFKRKISGSNTIFETSVLFEYYFFDINDIKYSGSSPYIFAGVGGYGFYDRKYTINHTRAKNYDGSYRDPLNFQDFVTEENYKKSMKFDFNIPFGVGYKFKIKYDWLLSLEIGARYTFQDNLDYSSIKNKNITINIDPQLNNISTVDPKLKNEINRRNAKIIGKHQTGNTYKSNDWYLIWGINLTYTFGRPPCYCY